MLAELEPQEGSVLIAPSPAFTSIEQTMEFEGW